MLKTLDKISSTVKDFGDHRQFEDWLMEVGRSSRTDTKELCTDINYVSGCTSNVWITGNNNNNKWKFNYYSSTLFTNGIVSILCETCNDMTTTEINDITFSEFDIIASQITLNKKKGLQAMINHIKNIVNT